MLELRADSRNNDSRCPYCHARVVETERLWTCPSCETVHHQDCARENQVCTLLGCGQPVVTTVVAGAPLPPIDRSAAEGRSSRQDLLVLAVCIPTLILPGIAGAFGVLSAAKNALEAEGIGYLPVLLTLAFIAGLAAILRFARWRDLEEEPRPPERPPVKPVEKS